MEDIYTPPGTLGQTATSGSANGPMAAPQTNARGAGASERGWDSHPVNIRFTIPLLFRNYYMTLLIGPERRSPERRAIERQKHPLLTFGNVIIYLLAGGGWLIFLSTIYQLLYLGV